jgi:UDP-glucuronate decarboxylase
VRKRVLVTGGAGFLGSHLCDKLIEENYYVICVDNLYTGAIENIRHLDGNKNFEFIKHDITVPLYVECEEIYNLACPASPKYYQHDPVITAKTSIYGSVNMLDLAERTNSKILQASTSEVYGDPQVHPQPECYWGNVNPIGNRSCYDEGKRAAETFFMDYYRKYRVPVKIMRIFNAYGPRMSINDGRVVSNFIVQSLHNRDVTIYGGGRQTRSFCYAEDLIDAMIRFMDTDIDFTGPVNIGNPDEYTILELAEKIIELTGSQSDIVFQDLPEDDPVRRKPDISLAKETLKWEPSVSLEEGLKDTITYFKQLCEVKI